MNVTILGAGAWGTAVAVHISKVLEQSAPSEVCLWARNPQNANLIQVDRENKSYLKGIFLPATLKITSDWKQSLTSISSEKDFIIIATPIAGLEQTVNKLCEQLLLTKHPIQNWIWLSKGIHAQTGKLPHEIVESILQEKKMTQNVRYGVLSGPSFAQEVAQGKPCALTIASRFPELKALTQSMFHHQSMRIYPTEDIIGVEVGGAVKNVLAIATGISDGLDLGLNARAALLTRGMHEMSRLGLAMGAKLETFLGLAGLGDLILTATGDLSRNRRVGLELAKNRSLEDVLQKLGHVAEGVRCAIAIEALAMKHHVEVPIVTAVCDILFRG